MLNNIPSFLPPLSIYKNLVHKDDCALFEAYCAWYKLLSIRALKQKHINENTFNLLYRAVSHPWKDTTLLGYLQKEFIQRNLSLSILLEPIDGFGWLSKNRYPLVYSKATALFLQIIAPFSRFISVLNNQKPPFYQPFSNLIFIYIALYLANMPQLDKILKKGLIEIKQKDIKKQLSSLHNEAKNILSVTYGIVFKLKISFFLGLSTILIQKNNKHTKNKLDFLDYVNSFLYGLWYTITNKDKTQGLDKI